MLKRIQLILLSTMILASSPLMATQPVGLTAGEFRVDESGAATYQLPLNLPQGTAGVVPQLGLSYSSSNTSEGPLGVGWSLSGLSSITRCPQTPIYDDGHIQAFTGNEYATALENGDVIAVIGWSGDLGQLGEDFGFDLPESGGSIFVDNMLIPAGAEHKTNAEKLINFFYDPVVAARVAAYVQYISPVDGAAEELMKSDPALAENQLIFPSDELLKRAYSAMPFTSEQAAKYNEAWAKLIGN